MGNGEYDEHLQEMTSLNNIEEYTDEKIEFIFNRLLKTLPNNGCLYKYKALDNDKSFNELFDALDNGYIYLANPSDMNDGLDGTLFYDQESLDEALKYLRSRPDLVLSWVLTREGSSNYDHSIGESLESDNIKRLFKFYDDSNNKINEYMAVDYLTRKTTMSIFDAANIVKNLNYAIKELYGTYEKTTQEVINNFAQINNSSYRDMNKIYCLCSSYTNNSMWAKYANNKGVCVEYDFNGLRNKAMEIKRLMISIYKVMYSDKKPKHSFLADLKYMFKDDISLEEMAEHNRNSVISLITKETSWANEDEWRIVLSVDYHKLYCDFVSKIYITDNLVGTDYYNRLKELADKHGWPLIIRETNNNKTGYDYIDSNCF